MRDLLKVIAFVSAAMSVVVLIIGVSTYARANVSIGSAGRLQQWDLEKAEGLVRMFEGGGGLITSVFLLAAANVYGFIEDIATVIRAWAKRQDGVQ